ncbi:metal-dependent phosphohydrolase [Brucella abortus]|uniref:metal-dependent phosphohydrolase n=1 Tax=Brucella abortus TaxID=235 RepID=UPI00163B7CCC|nr:metal-dependent phosphohydrolase [Brucella abortus]
MGEPHLYQVEDGWIETRSGRRFHFADPMAHEIVLEDVADVLPRLCRYNGHTRRWYSVAEHCCLMADWVEKQPWATPLDALTALHHDDAEYIIGDLPRPIKQVLPEFKAIEERLDRAVSIRFGTIWPFPAWLKEVDSRILRDERGLVMNPSDNEWGTDELEPLGVRPWEIMGRLQWFVRGCWLGRHRRLTRLVLDRMDQDGHDPYLASVAG